MYKKEELEEQGYVFVRKLDHYENEDVVLCKYYLDKTKTFETLARAHISRVTSGIAIKTGGKTFGIANGDDGAELFLRKDVVD